MDDLDVTVWLDDRLDERITDCLDSLLRVALSADLLSADVRRIDDRNTLLLFFL